jgi:hypothetical protein
MDIPAYDKEHPLLPPPPMCGQVWVLDADGNLIRQVVSVTACQGGHAVYFGGTTYMWDPGFNGLSQWPPRGATLVAGPGSPWSPLAMGEEEAP